MWLFWGFLRRLDCMFFFTQEQFVYPKKIGKVSGKVWASYWCFRIYSNVFEKLIKNRNVSSEKIVSLWFYKFLIYGLFCFYRKKIEEVRSVLCGGHLKFMQLARLRSRYLCVHDKVAQILSLFWHVLASLFSTMFLLRFCIFRWL